MSKLHEAAQDVVDSAGQGFASGFTSFIPRGLLDALKAELNAPPIDTSKFDKPFFELTKAEKLALCEAAIDGADVQIRTMGGWGARGGVRFYDAYTYRTKPNVELVDGEWYSFVWDGREHIGKASKSSGGQILLYGEWMKCPANPHSDSSVVITKHIENPFD